MLVISIVLSLLASLFLRRTSLNVCCVDGMASW